MVPEAILEKLEPMHVSSTSLIISYQKKLKHFFFIQMDVEGKITIIHFLYSLVDLKKCLKKIHLIFPIRGHSFLPCDRDFASVELRNCKVETLYVPDQWISIIEDSRVHNKFDVV